LLFAPLYFRYYENRGASLTSEEKARVQDVIGSSIGTVPRLQTENNLPDWKRDTLNNQTVLMDDILNNLSITGSSLSGRPQKYISANYSSMIIYIPYSDFDPAGSIVIKEDNKFYLASCSSSDSIQKVINYMIKNNAIK
jgi:hypothetical protein